jgi:hypothetical protein
MNKNENENEKILLKNLINKIKKNYLQNPNKFAQITHTHTDTK